MIPKGILKKKNARATTNAVLAAVRITLRRQTRIARNELGEPQRIHANQHTRMKNKLKHLP